MPSASSSSSPLGDDPIIIEVSDTDDDGSGGVALSTKVAERIASSLTQEELDAICSKYGVPEQYSAVLPAGHQRACSPLPPGAICVNEHALEAGMRVPLHAFFCEVLAHFGVAPIQIAPNGWRAMAGFIVLSHKAGVAPSLPVFRHFFSLCGFRFKGWYYFRGKDVAGALFKGMPPSFAGWKEAFFFLKSPTPWPCRVKWGHELSKGSTVEPVLTKEEERVAKKLLDVHGEAVDIKTYLSESNLAAAMITGSSAKLPPPPPTTTMTPLPTRTTRSASAKGMDPSATQAQGQASGVTVKPEPGSDTSSLGKKMKVTDDAAKLGPSRPQPSTPLGHAHGLFPGVPPSPPGMATHKSLKMHLSTGSAAKPSPPPLLSIRTSCSASAKGMDPQVYDMMKNLRAAKAAQAQAAVATVNNEVVAIYHLVQIFFS